jgi:hypothetical protein
LVCNISEAGIGSLSQRDERRTSLNMLISWATFQPDGDVRDASSRLKARCIDGKAQVYTRHLMKTFLRRRPAPLEAG